MRKGKLFSLPMRHVVLTSVMCAGSAMSCTEAAAPLPPAAETGTPVDAWSGGTVSLGAEVTLRVPASSLARDTRIAIARLQELPDGGELGGFVATGQGYELTPHGTAFALAQPARVSVQLDRAALAARHLDARTAQLFHYDEAAARYEAVAGVLEGDGVLVASIEHFSKYVVMAQAQAVGAPGPVVAMQAPVPNPIRAGSPIYLRATVLPAAGTSIAAVRVRYRKLHPAGQPYELGVMTPDRSPVTPGPNTYGYLVPAAALGAADLAAGNDLEWYVEATDTLGVTRSLAATPMGHDVTRRYTAGTLAVVPATLDISSGFEKWLPLVAQDDLPSTYQIVPETLAVTRCPGAAAPPMGTVEDQRASGLHFTAQHACAGTLSVGASGEVKDVPVVVRGGQLAAIELFKYEQVGGTEVRTRLEGTYSISEGQVLELDAQGRDAYGNTMNVNVSWQADAALGSIDGSGRLYTLDGGGFGEVTASVGGQGGVRAVQWVNVIGRSWAARGGALNAAAPATWISVASDPSGSHLFDTATRLADGRVLRVSRNTAQLYHPGTGTWTTVQPPSFARIYHAVSLTPSGAVLATGGLSFTRTTAERFDPVTSTWSVVAPLLTGRGSHQQVLLPDGRVLIIGGSQSSSLLAQVDAYDESANRWTAVPALRVPRADHAATVLDDGRVLVTGGTSASGVERTVELRDPVTEEWTVAAPMGQRRALHVQVALPGGKVLVAGGTSAGASAELYDPGANTWTAVAPMTTPRVDAAAAVLDDGRVLVAGGSDGAANALASADLYDPVANTWTAVAMAVARGTPTATRLASGRVLVTSGFEATAEIYLPGQPAPRPQLASTGTAHYVAWHEPNAIANRVQVRQWTGTGWVAVGASPVSDPAREASWPRLALHPLSGAPHLVWQEQGARAQEIQVRRWTGVTWEQDGGASLNVDTTRDAATPALAFVGPTPHVAWAEVDGAGRGQIYVRRWNGAAWVQLGGSLNRAGASHATAPAILALGPTPYVAWTERGAGSAQLFVARWDGAAWAPVGGSLNVNAPESAADPTLLVEGGELYAGWRETFGGGAHLNVSRWTGTAWERTLVAGDPVFGGRSPQLAAGNGTPYVAWREPGADHVMRLFVRHRASPVWRRDGGALNVDPARDAFAPSLTFAGATPLAAWAEANGTTYSIYVKALE